MAPAASPRLFGFAVSVIPLGAASSSTIVTVPERIVVPASAPETRIVSSPSWSTSFTGVTVNVPVAPAAPAGIVTLTPATAA